MTEDEKMVHSGSNPSCAEEAHTSAEPSAEREPVWMAAVAYTQDKKWFLGLMGCRARNRFEAEGRLRQTCRDQGRTVEQITLAENPMEHSEPQRSKAATPASQSPGTNQ